MPSHSTISNGGGYQARGGKLGGGGKDQSLRHGGRSSLEKKQRYIFFSVGSTDLANSPELLQGGDFAYAVRMFTGQFHGFTKNQDRHVARLMVLQIEPKNDLQSC
jgi:hypothetical protein